MTPKHLVAIGTSAGGIEALRTVLGALPADFPAPVCVVMHTAPHSPGALPGIIDRASPLVAVSARNGERLQAGRIYVAPPDCHLLVEPGKARTSRGPKENSFRPAIDPLFRSAAQVYGPGAIGVVLTGGLDDGTAGLWAIKQLGGVAIVQDPDEALYPGMPLSAINNVKVDHVVRLGEIAPLLARLTAVPLAAERIQVPDAVDVEVDVAKEKDPMDAGLERIAEPSIYTCPECHGVLLQLKDKGGIRFRCHTGHAYSVESLLAAIATSAEESLWTAIRVVHEGEMLLENMAEHFEERHNAAEAAAFTERARELRRRYDIMRTLVTEGEPLVAEKP